MVGVLIACTTILGGIVSAQQGGQPSRARWAVDKAQDAAEATGGGVGDAFNGAKGEFLRGTLVIFENDPGEAQKVNNRGLIVVRIPDLQSHLPQHISVKPQPERDFQHPGQVQGVTAKNGRPQAGGGLTFDQWRPRNECDATFQVAYTPNGGGKPVDQMYCVKVVASKK